MEPLIGKSSIRNLLMITLTVILAIIMGLSLNAHAQTSTGTPVNSVPAGTYWGFEIGSYSSSTNTPLPPGSYTVTFNEPVTVYLLISPSPPNWSACHGVEVGAPVVCSTNPIPQGTIGFMSTSGSISFTLTEPEYVNVLTVTYNINFTITRNGIPLSVTAISNAPNQVNTCGYNGYPYGIQGCGPIYLILWLTDGTNLYYIYSLGSGFGSSPYQGETSIPLTPANTVSGTQLPTITLSMPPTYTVTFTETGLPSSTSWSVTFNGQTESSTSSSITFNNVQSGTYTYSINAPQGYTATPSSGTVSVSTSSVNVQVTFTPIMYTITFVESGLPSGAEWSVTFNGVSNSSTTNTITFTVPAGTYSYTVGSVPGYTATPSYGSITLSSSTSVPITFTPMVYTLTFTESGLPNGITWGVVVNGTPYYTNESSISINLRGGVYSFSIATPSGYSASPNTGSINLVGNEGVTITFTANHALATTTTAPSISMTMIIAIAAIIVAIVAVTIALTRRK